MCVDSLFEESNNKDFIKSPLNYTGNKYRILCQITPFFPPKAKVVVDLFCGGATVGLNMDCEKIIFVDNNRRVINLLKFLANQDFYVLLRQLELYIEKYKLSYSARYGYSHFTKIRESENKNNGLKAYNTSGFSSLKSDYNLLKDKETDSANAMLYLLLVYGFNNDLRFNRNGEYNLPCGKTDLNKSNIKKIKAFIDRMKEIDAEFICGDFRDEKIKNIIYTSDFVYLDPPYLITDAVYNEANRWDEESEWDLLHFLESLFFKKVPFVLSNVIRKKGQINEPLNTWTKENKKLIEVNDINYHYRSASYNKKNRDAAEEEIVVVYKGK